MEEEEWAFKQILKNRKRLRELLQSDIKEVENGKRITDLPSDVLALCLSYKLKLSNNLLVCGFIVNI